MPELLLQDKYNNLVRYLNNLGSVAIAFSGGVDSTFLLKVSHDVLSENAVAVIAALRSFPEWERKEAEAFCQREGIRYFICEIDELEIEGFSDNPENRCYLCKTELLRRIRKVAADNAIAYVAEGSNTDDEGDYRPGLMAVEEQKIKSPLRDNALSKADIRKLSKDLGLTTWNKQSFACLSTRFVYGERITMEKLDMVEKAEYFLFKMGFTQVRVRMHDRMARIEISPEEFEKLLEKENASKINRELKSYGFTYVSLDLGGYRTGSMNDAIK